jgi:hypothetical protein
MQVVQVPVSTFESLIDSLESALKVCYNVDSTSDDSEKSYPFATGYSKATMQMIVDELNHLKSQAK